jgi:hypothetical protein
MSLARRARPGVKIEIKDKLIPSWREIKNRYLVLSGIARGCTRAMPRPDVIRVLHPV